MVAVKPGKAPNITPPNTPNTRTGKTAILNAEAKPLNKYSVIIIT